MADIFEDLKQCRTWEEMTNLCKRIGDRLGMPVDPHILETVAVLNLLDIVTTASCGGHEDHGTFAPYIDIKAQDGQEAEQAEQKAWRESEQLREQGTSREAFGAARALVWPLQRQAQTYQLDIRTRLLGYLDAFYIQHSASVDQRLVLHYLGYQTRLESQGAGLQTGRTEEERAQKLKVYQEEMASFSAFLKERWSSQKHRSESK